MLISFDGVYLWGRVWQSDWMKTSSLDTVHSIDIDFSLLFPFPKDSPSISNRHEILIFFQLFCEFGNGSHILSNTSGFVDRHSGRKPERQKKKSGKPCGAICSPTRPKVRSIIISFSRWPLIIRLYICHQSELMRYT